MGGSPGGPGAGASLAREGERASGFGEACLPNERAVHAGGIAKCMPSGACSYPYISQLRTLQSISGGGRVASTTCGGVGAG